jgi:nicotinamide mononucleotide transporter
MDALLQNFSFAALLAVMLGLEFWGAVTGVWDVWLCMKEDIKNFPVGILNITIFFFMFWNQKLYGSAVLQVFFLVLSIWGWYVWLKGTRNTKEVTVSKDMTVTEGLLALTIGSIATYWFGLYLATTGDPSPTLDSALAIFSVIAMYFMSKKVVQCWYIWISIDMVSIWVYSHAGLYITSVLYFVFLCMCLKGLHDWKNEPLYVKLRLANAEA